MRGKFNLTRVDKVSGKEELIYSDRNQVTEGMKQSIVALLSGDGSKNTDDYRFRYFQLGNQKYDLNTYDISGDLTSSSFKSYFWTLKNPLNNDQYGYDSRVGVVRKPGYVLGSVLNENAGGGKVLDNFVQPPDIKTVLNEFSNYMPTPLDGDYLKNDATLSSIWDIGCADAWLFSPENRNVNPMPVVPDYSVSGPDFKVPTWKASYTTSRYLLNEDGSNAFSTACLRNSHAYIYVGPVQSHTQGEIQGQYTKLKKNQTSSFYVAGKHYVSSVGGNPWPNPDASALSGTNYSGKLSLFARSLQVLAGTNAGQNHMFYKYRYDYDNSAATYTPRVLSVSSGYQNQQDAKGDAEFQFSSLFGLTSEEEYGVVSGNIYNRYGAVYTYADHLNSYSTESGPGASGSLMDTSNVGFGPGGNFYRIALTWANASDKMINYYSKEPTVTYDGIVLVNFLRTCESSVSGIDSAGDVSAHTRPETTPRSSANVTFFQYDFAPSASPMQIVHGEESYYLTSSQDFAKILKDRTTYLNDGTVNVRLEVDEDLANSQTLREVGLYTKNPLGFGIDTPLLAAYKALPEDINKSNQFSYIVDWEFSFIDEDGS